MHLLQCKTNFSFIYVFEGEIYCKSFIFVYIRLDSSSDSSALVYIRLQSYGNSSTLVYIPLHLSSDSSRLVYIRLHSSSDSAVLLEQIFKNICR